jgi:molybdenum cofactor cytidylyltransferase
MISGILLAAGESSRMAPEFKPLLKWGTKTVIEACIDNLRRSRLDEILVVLGHREAELRERLAAKGVQFVINPDYRSGMLTSIKRGWSEISPQSEAVMIALVDQPTVTSSIIDRVVTAFWKGDKKIVVPVFEGKHGHPVILDREFEQEVMRLEDAAPDGLKTLIHAHKDDILEVPVNSSSVLDDIDNPGDYERLSRVVEPFYEHHKWHP